MDDVLAMHQPKPIGMPVTSVCDLGRYLEQAMVLYVSCSSLSHDVCVVGRREVEV